MNLYLHKCSLVFSFMLWGAWFTGQNILAETLANNSPAALFNEANKAYDAGNYPSAIEHYRTIIRQGYASSETFYNLANALFRNGVVGEAIVNYRRAWFLNPRDADVLANLNLAVQRTGAFVPDSSLINRSIRELSLHEWLIAFKACYWLAVATTVLALLLPVTRRWLKPVAVTFWIMAFICLGGWANWYYWQNKSEAVVVAGNQTALYEPRSSSTPYFAVPEGSIVNMQDNFDAWVKISAGNKSGWLPKSVIERVYPWKHDIID